MITQNKLYWREQTIEDKKEKLPSKTLTAKNQFIETFTQSVDNTGFLTLRFLHFL